MKAVIERTNINGSIAAPPSKSMTQRVYAAALLHTGKTIINGTGNSDDELAALAIIQELGAKIIARTRTSIEIYSEGVRPLSGIIHCGESGLSARLFMPIAALSDKTITVTGGGTLYSRPMAVFSGVFPQLNVSITSNDGHLPIELMGPLLPVSITMDGSESSQFLSGLLFAFCYAITEPEIVITVHGLKSRPYIDMTLGVLKTFGYNVAHENYREFYIRHPDADLSGKEIAVTIAGDWSSAAYFLVGGALAGDIAISGLTDDHLQADSAIFSLLRDAGADIAWSGDRIRVKQSKMTAFEFDATDCPDLFPVLAILAACCEGESYIKGVHRLLNKESNRAESISEMLSNFEVPYSVEDDSFCITGVQVLQGTVIDSFHDHRIVMAAAIGALQANSQVDILHAEAVNKSYPDFFKDLILCGGRCILKP